jgi:hypothetical protein
MKTIIKWGIILGLAVSLGTQILTWLGLGLTNWFLLLTYALLIMVLILVYKELKHQHEGKIGFGKVLLWVFGIILISRIVFQLYMFIYTRYIDPEWIDSVAEIWKTALETSSNSNELIETQLDNFRKSYETIPMFTTALLSYAIPQFVIGLIASTIFYFTQKPKLSH